MQYTDITEYNATSFTEASRTIDDIDTIVIHHWGDDNQRFEKVCEFFAGGPGTSAHFVVESGRCAQLVEIKDIAWHAGKPALDWHRVPPRDEQRRLRNRRPGNR